MSPETIKFYKYKPVDKPQFADKFCHMPFTTLQIDYDGDVLLCDCQFHMPYSIGNIYQNTLEEIWQGHLAEKVRQSITNGTFHYCSWDCAHLYNLPTRKNFVLPSMPFPTTIKIDMEKSCNLKCPSCRETVIIEKQSDRIDKQIAIYQEIVDKAKASPTTRFTIVPCASGEIFASHSGLAFLKSLQNYPYSNLKVHVATNGTLINKNKSWLTTILPLIERFSVSVDAATEDTYAKVRGGDWQELHRGLDFLQTNKITTILRFVVQKHNFHEIVSFFDLTKKYNSNVFYASLQDWGHWTIQWWHDNTVVKQNSDQLPKILQDLSAIKSADPNKVFFDADLAKLLQKYVQKTQ